MRLQVVSAIALALALGPAGACKKGDEGNDQPKADPVPKASGGGETPKEKPAEDKPKAPDPELVERGAYLAALGGCASCHTPIGPHGPDMSKAYAGGMEVKEAFGTWRAPNITPDRKTGIGDWSDEEILAAIRQGKEPNGNQLYPMMPYMFYNKLSDEDGKALVAFLRSLKPVENAVEGNTDLKLPKPPVPEPNGEAPPEGDKVAQGAYLASVMHCPMCHTPMSESGAPDMTRAFAGGFEFEIFPPFGEGKVYSANITPDKKTGIGGWTDEQIVAAIRQMKRPEGKPMIGLPMIAYIGGWSQLEDEDAANLVAFLRSLKPIKNKVPKSTFKPSKMMVGMMEMMKAGGPPQRAPGEEPKKE